MLFRRANSSFIFDRRRLSMRLCAVFLAIFLPAALVLDGRFFLFPAEMLGRPSGPAAVLECAFDTGALLAMLEELVSSWRRGFICMILCDRAGGGGRANWSLDCCGADDRLLDFTVSLGDVDIVALGNAVSSDGVRCCWLG